MNNLIKKGQSDLKLYDKDQFIKKYSPAGIKEDHKNISSVILAIKADNNSLAVCRRDVGEQYVIDVIVMHIVSLCQSINVNQTLSGIQVKELAHEIISIYYNISVVEIAYVFRLGKRGDYGKIGSYALNQEDVMDWFHKYQDQRCVEFQKNQEKEHNERINGKVEIDEEGNYMTVFVDEFKKGSEGQAKIFGAIKDSLGESDEEKYNRIKEDIKEKGIESTFVDQSQNKELNDLKNEINKKYGI